MWRILLPFCLAWGISNAAKTLFPDAVPTTLPTTVPVKFPTNPLEEVVTPVILIPDELIVISPPPLPLSPVSEVADTPPIISTAPTNLAAFVTVVLAIPALFAEASTFNLYLVSILVPIPTRSSTNRPIWNCIKSYGLVTVGLIQLPVDPESISSCWFFHLLLKIETIGSGWWMFPVPIPILWPTKTLPSK